MVGGRLDGCQSVGYWSLCAKFDYYSPKPAPHQFAVLELGHHVFWYHPNRVEYSIATHKR